MGMCGGKLAYTTILLKLGKSFNAFGTIMPTTSGEEMEGGIGREGKPQHTQPLSWVSSVGITTGFPSPSVGDSLPDRKKNLENTEKVED